MSGFAVLHSQRQWATWLATTGRRTTLAVGNFDGLHLGHRKILGDVLATARATGTSAVAVTFEPHPLKVLRPGQSPPLIETMAQRLAGLQSMQLDAAAILKFDLSFAALSPREFVTRVLLEGLHMSAILAGENFRFGCKQAGNLELLLALGKESHFAVQVVPPVLIDGQVVSSTAVRQAVLEGRVTDAERMLNRPFSLTGGIEGGSCRGSQILFPTLNLRPDQELLPKTGVYATQVRVGGPGGQLYGAATNVGFRPTFDGRRLSIESHLFDFSQRLQSGHLEVLFRELLRDEKKFAGPVELRQQIAADLDRARQLLAGLDRAPSPQKA